MVKLNELQEAAIKAYGIEPKYVLAAGERDGAAVIVTTGGTKVRYARGQAVLPLSARKVTGKGPDDPEPKKGEKK